MKEISAICAELIGYNRPERSVKNLKLLYSTIDLTNLKSNAIKADIEALTTEALKEEYEGIEIPKVAAVCVYPTYVAYCSSVLKNSGIQIATVTGVFPHSQSYSEVKYLETEMAIQHGATEIDIVLNISAFLNKGETVAYDEIKTIKQICGDKHLKVILETGLLKERSLIEQAATMAIEAGADFIKTSTGKDGSVASLEAVYIMCGVIKEHFANTGHRIGLKPAGGISATDDALNYLAIINEVLSKEWSNKELFRLGASRLANNLLTDLFEIT